MTAPEALQMVSGVQGDHVMSENVAKVTSKQQQAITALLQHSSIKKAAVACGIAEKTLRRWLRQAAFLAAWCAARQRTFEAAVAELERHALRAVRTLAKNLRAEKPSDQNRAADLLLGHRKEYVELHDLLQRVQALEERQKQGAKP
jgi:hypothetical protein